MIDIKKLVLPLAIGACFSLQSFAAENEQQDVAKQAETQTLELETVDVASLELSLVQDEADENSAEIHQEATLGRAGLTAYCM